MEIKGTIKQLFPTILVSEKFSKRDIVVTTTTETYPQDLIIQFTQDKCAVLDLYKIGDNVEVSINLKGREWTNPQGEIKYFNTIEGWRISNVGGQMQATTQAPTTTNDDMPF